MLRFSKLKKRIESFFATGLEMKIYCTVYHNSKCLGMDQPRIWITLNDEIIFDFIKDFLELKIPDPNYEDGRPVYYSDIEGISSIIHEYIETPVDKLFVHVFDKDLWGLTDILKAADRRIGKQRLSVLQEKTQSDAVKKVIDMRLGDTEKVV